MANAEHFNVEINIPALEAMCVSKQRPRPSVDEYTLADGRRLRLLAEGRLVNLVTAEGHPSAVMDMSFANQVLCAVHMVTKSDKLDSSVYKVPAEIDQEVARLKLAAMNIRIDELTEEQECYLSFGCIRDNRYGLLDSQDRKGKKSTSLVK